MEQTQKILTIDVLESLEEREQSILKLYYWAGFSKEEISESYQITQQRVNQIKKRAITKLRKMLNGEDSVYHLFT